MLKKFFALSLAVLMLLGCFTACGNAEPAETTEPKVTEPAEEAKVLKVLTLGHSLAVDTGHMLNMIAATQGFDGYEEVFIGTLYHSGCRLSQHVDFIRANSADYNLYLSSTATPGEPPEIMNGVTMQQALAFEYWDIIVMMGNPWEIDVEAAFENGNIQFIQEYVKENVANPNFIFAWHMPWALPGDEELLKMYPYEPNSHYNNHLKRYNLDKSAHYEAQVSCVEKYIVPDETFAFVIPSGTTIQNAWSSYLEEKDLHRDYAHASDLGRVMASYTWYCMLLGIEQLDEIKLDAIPKAFLKSTADKSQDRPLTEAEKAIILESVNNALANPYQMTQSQYTEAPAQ